MKLYRQIKSETVTLPSGSVGVNDIISIPRDKLDFLINLYNQYFGMPINICEVVLQCLKNQ